MNKKIFLFVFLFLLVGTAGFALVERDNINASLRTDLTQQEKTYSGRIDEMTAYQEGLVVKINKLQDNYSTLSIAYDKLQETYQAYVDENELKLDNLKTELASVKQSLADLQASSDVDKAKITELQNKITNLEKSISEKNVTIEQLNSTIETQKATIEELNSTIAELTADLNSDLAQLDFYKSLMTGDVTEITVQDLAGVTKIRNYAFQGMALTSIELPSSLVSVGSYAFARCLELSDISFGDSLVSIGDYAFNCCPISTVAIPFGVETIGRSAFSSDVLEEVSLPTTLKSVGDGLYSAFDLWGNSGEDPVLTVKYMGTLTDFLSMSNCAIFSRDTITNNLYIDGNLLTKLLPSDFGASTRIPQCAFYRCSSLTSVTLSNDIEKINTYAFSRCSNLNYFSFGNNSKLTSIGNFLYGSNNISNPIILPASTLEIGSFSNLSNLPAIFIPISVTTIAGQAFAGCYNSNTGNVLTIYCEATSAQSGWNKQWNFKASTSTYTPKWGYTLEQYKAEVGITDSESA